MLYNHHKANIFTIITIIIIIVFFGYWSLHLAMFHCQSKQATDLTTWVTLILQVLSAVEDTPAATLLAVLIPNLVTLNSAFPS